jgi:hypothetical protein
MSNPKQKQLDRNELELEAETISDLEVKEQQDEDIGGGCINGTCYNSMSR